MAKDLPLHERLHSAFVAEHPRPVEMNELPSLTHQEFADECDINTIMARYEKTGGTMPIPSREPVYLDLTDMPDFQTAMQLMIDAESAFMQLPALTRREFDNDPAKFVQFAEDPENLDQMRKWGLAPEAKVAEPPIKVEVMNQVPAEPEIPAKK